jgi:hypothetical protein
MKAEQRKRNFLCCPVDVEIHDFCRGPSMGNQPEVSGNEFLNKVASTENILARWNALSQFLIPATR